MIAVLLWTVLLQSSATAPASPEPSLDGLRREQADRFRSTVADLPEMPGRPIGQVISLQLHDGLIAVQSDLGDSGGVHRIALTDAPGITTIRAATGDVQAQRAAYLDFQHIDIAPPGKVYELLQIFAIDGRVQLAVDSATPAVESRVQLIQSAASEDPADQRVKLYFDEFDAKTEEQLRHSRLAAPTFAELLRAHPEEVLRRVIGPLRRRNLHGGLLATPAPLAWQVLGDEVSIPVGLGQRVAVLVDQLNSEEFAQRERAAASLRELGPPAAMTLRKLDRTTLSEEQRQSIDAIIAPYSRADRNAIDALRASRVFLIGCLYCDDPAIWPAAASRLEQHFSVTVKIADTPEAMRAEADRLLDLLSEPPADPGAR